MTPIELQLLIKENCDTWLNSMGYTLHFLTPTYLTYSTDVINDWLLPIDCV